jgi:tRNA splicing endonuclease
MQARFEDFLDRNANSEEARAVVAAEQREIELYEAYKAYVSYGVYVARKLECGSSARRRRRSTDGASRS